MFDILYKYLIIHRNAVLPGIGIFEIHRQPASFNFSNKMFIAPSAHITFNPRGAEADTRFYSFAAKERQIAEAEAVTQVDQLARTLKENLQAAGRVEVPGFGFLLNGENGVLQFSQGVELPSVFRDIVAERTVREASTQPTQRVAAKRKDRQTALAESKEPVKQASSKSYWWILVVILAAAAIAAIGYYYYQNGSFQ